VLSGAAVLLTSTLSGAASAADAGGLADVAAFDCGAACERQPVVLARAGVSYPPADVNQSYRSQTYNRQTNENSDRYRRKKEREKRYEKAKRDRRERIDRYDSRYRRYRDGADHQPGGYCIYDAKGNVILRPDGVVCDNDQDENGYMAGSSDSGQPGSGPAKIDPKGATRGQTGCVQGDCKNGRGIYVWSGGAHYTGQFRNGLQHGEGTLALPNGSRYVGQWHTGKRHGQGTGTYADGRVQKGMWEQNRFAGATDAAVVRIRWPDLSRIASQVGGGERDAAVVVGVENYAHVARVPQAADNASDWYSYLVKTRRVPLENVILMLEEDATMEEMRWSAEEAARRVQKGGTLWFVFIGHGAPARDGKDGLLVGFDAQQKARSIEARSLSRSLLLKKLTDSKAKRIQVLLDACFSGQSTNGEQLVAGLQPLVVTSLTATQDPRLTLMTAAGSDEYAGPLPGAARPAFSYLALGGLRGWADSNADGKVTSGELHGYVTHAMRALVRDRRQRPTLLGEAEMTFGHSSREKGPDLAQMVLGSAQGAR